jgi:hypothetical protein
LRIDLHVVRELHRWHLQSARGATLAVFEGLEEALSAAHERARETQGQGFSARVMLHQAGKATEVFDFPPQ